MFRTGGFFCFRRIAAERRRMNSFMSWVGGKKSLRDKIIVRFPLNYGRYIEVFGGAGWVLFHKTPEAFEVFNDANSNLVNLYRCVRQNARKLIYKLRYMINARDDFRCIVHQRRRGIFARFHDYDRAARFYYLIQYSYGHKTDQYCCKPVSMWKKFPLTREGAATVKENNGTAPATKKQQELISLLLKDFSYSKNSFSYEEYKNRPTQKNASKFIEETIEHNADIVANKKNYMGYLANRPGAVKFSSHGLFSQTDEPISLQKVAKEVSEHKGNVWTHVVSLRRDDAQKMGYDNLNAWRELIKRQIPNIAKQSKIDMANLKWYAAFHDNI